MSVEYKDKIILVTGASRGIGYEIGRFYLRAGAQVISCARRAPETALQEGKRKADFVPADIRKTDDVVALFSYIKKKYKRLDILINNAGGAPQRAVADSSPSLLESVIRLNLIAPLWVAQEAHRLMKRGSVIVNIASVAGQRAAPHSAAYGAAKAGLINLTRTLAMEWGGKIRVNAIVPGLTIQEETAKYYGGKAEVKRLSQIVPAGRFARPEDIANACLFLTSAEATYLSGAVLEVHGGGEMPAFTLLQDQNNQK